MNSFIRGRYAPSPSGDLHVGNLRTAVVACMAAPDVVLRIDDIDAQRSSLEHAQRQQADLHALGMRFSGPVVRQQESLAHYAAALQRLRDAGMVYECYCSRKDIQEASRAPHAIPGSYPGVCRNLSDAEREAKRAELAAAGRVPALRLAAQVGEWTIREAFAAVAVDGRYTGPVDDMVLRRGGNVEKNCAPGEPGDDGAGGHGNDYAYNLAVVVDDHLAGVNQVVRGDDLLSSAPRQDYLAHVLGIDSVEYVHIPLVLGPAGQRLAKRDGAVTLRQLEEAEPGAAPRILDWILRSILPEAKAQEVLSRDGNTAEKVRWASEIFELSELPKQPVTWQF